MNSDYRWLPNSFLKQIPFFPEIEFGIPHINCGGYYCSPSKTYPKGLIFVNTDNEERIASTIAHELRHHWQQFNFVKDSISSGIFYGKYFHRVEYNEFIKMYFTKFKTEEDALRFEFKVAKEDINEYWLKGLLNGV